MSDELASCDCCGEMVSHNDIGRVVAYSIETYACGRCRGQMGGLKAPTDAEIDRAQRRLELLIGKEFLE